MLWAGVVPGTVPTCSSGLAATCWKNEDWTSGSSTQCGTARTMSGSIPAQLCRYLAKSFTCGRGSGGRGGVDVHQGTRLAVAHMR